MTSTVSALGTGTTSYSYDPNDRLTTDGYNANGNTTSSGGVSNILYDFENRMTTYGTTTLGYDGDGNRVSESVGGPPQSIWWTPSTRRPCRKCWMKRSTAP